MVWYNNLKLYKLWCSVLVLYLFLVWYNKRGHHKNIKLSRNPDPKNKKDAYIRDDIEEHNKNALKQKLNHFRKLPKEDVEKAQKVINKKKK